MVIVITFAKGDQLDGAGAAVPLQGFEALEGAGDDLGDEVVGVEEECLEQLVWWECGDDFVFEVHNTHDNVFEIGSD